MNVLLQKFLRFRYSRFLSGMKEAWLDGLCLNQPFRNIENILWAINFSFPGLSVLYWYTSTFKNFRIYRYYISLKNAKKKLNSPLKYYFLFSSHHRRIIIPKKEWKKKKMINRSSHRAIILRPYKMLNV